MHSIRRGTLPTIEEGPVIRCASPFLRLSWLVVPCARHDQIATSRSSDLRVPGAIMHAFVIRWYMLLTDALLPMLGAFK